MSHDEALIKAMSRVLLDTWSEANCYVGSRSYGNPYYFCPFEPMLPGYINWEQRMRWQPEGHVGWWLDD